MARIDVLMPQMGESIAEGTLSKWLKKVGDAVKRDEPLFEISTDKVDAEIPSPSAGVLAEIKVQEGQTVPVHLRQRRPRPLPRRSLRPRPKRRPRPPRVRPRHVPRRLR
jgi:2-oxoglutarate dehydrogenase E2 component (dihydrolipoamide succinyltransferase)